MKYLQFLLAVFWVALSLPAASLSFPDSYTQHRERFLEAEQALKDQDRMKYWDLLKTLRDYPLYPYLRYEDLKLRLDTARPEEITIFIEAFKTSPVSARMRTAWLRSLAKNQRWDDFLKYYRPTKDKTLNCYREQARLHVYKKNSPIERVRSIWLTGASLPDECDELIKVWTNNNLLTKQMLKQRIQLALKKRNVNLARYLIKQLPSITRNNMLSWLRVYKNPRILLDDDIIQHPDAVALANFKFAALAWYYPDEAIKFAKKISRIKKFSSVRGKLNQILAISLARKSHAQASYWLGQVTGKYASDRVIKWKIRTALYLGDWQAVLSNINRLGKTERFEDRWQYWRARAYAQLKQTTKANTIYKKISQNRSYEAFLAADIINADYTFKHKDLDIDLKFVESLKNNAGMARTRELMLLKRFSQARSEWNRATAKLTSKQKASSAWLAYQWGWSHQAIVTLAGIAEWNDLALRFPLKHMPEIQENTRSTIIDPALALAVIRQESAFQENAVSASNARGLMQLMPATAKEVAGELKIKLHNMQQLNSPSVNIKLGVYYLNTIKNELLQHPVLAIAAYNAGKSRVKAWLNKRKVLPVDIWIETVPFKETRNYLRNILAYSVVYEKRLGLPVRRIKERMPPIPHMSAMDEIRL